MPARFEPAGNAAEKILYAHSEVHLPVSLELRKVDDLVGFKHIPADTDSVEVCIAVMRKFLRVCEFMTLYAQFMRNCCESCPFCGTVEIVDSGTVCDEWCCTCGQDHFCHCTYY